MTDPVRAELPLALKRPLILYAHTCRFCAWAAHVVATLDRRERLAFLSMLEPEAEMLLAPLPMNERYATWHLVLPDGTYLRRTEASVMLLDLIEPLRPLGFLVRRLRLQPLVGRLERLVSAYRGELGRLVPRASPVRRFP
jgi:predicted DCC family thiol-disulfide oxidoreductase YuxK